MMFRNYNKLYVAVFLLSLSIFYSCKYSKPKGDSIHEVTSFMGRSIHFASLFHDRINTLDTILWDKRNKIVIYLDSMNCTSCAFSEIRKWNRYTKDLKKLKTDIVIICSHPDAEAIRNMQKVMHVDFPVFFDIGKRFKAINRLPQEAIYQIFVVEGTNQVIWVGLPIHSKKSWEEFCSVIMLNNEV